MEFLRTGLRISVGRTNTHRISTSFNKITSRLKTRKRILPSSFPSAGEKIPQTKPTHISVFLQGEQFVFMARFWALSKIAVIFPG